jgi:dynein light chain roadblock-type
MNAHDTQKYSQLISELTERAKSMIREFDCENDLIFLRVRTKKNEVMIAPDNEYLLIVIQDLTS